MPTLTPISSAENPLVRLIVRLATAPRAFRDLSQTLAEGVHLGEILLTAPTKVRSVIMRKGAPGASFDLGERLATAHAAQFVELTALLYDRAAPVEHGAGLMALIDIPDPETDFAINGDAAYLDGVQDPGNVGTLLRTAAAAGIGTVCAAMGTAGFWSPRVLRAGMGAHWKLRLHERVAVQTFRSTFKGTIVAADGHAPQSLYATAWPPGEIGWMLGAEGSGVSPEARAACDLQLRIPLANGVESLNVAAAAAVCFFERRRCQEASDSFGALGAERRMRNN